ncbi:MAG: UDP-2,4-diacetamido-2,4,6-trideoxy-beta-L-altropyranose hydrolase [Lachnospiraceae bacterium]|nr:UDP-2,4-diacetamido-2,4,6-trideoxy-beta-L-altropyranose hydrolase [Lachnospiraceae bacterium]
MKVIIRADSNKVVAMGHVMRCLSIADALSDRGAEVVFFCATKDPEELITSRGYDVRVLNTDFDMMDRELDIVCPMLETEKPDVIILDTYYLTDKYVTKISEYAKTVYVDDYGKNAFPVDLIINYNIYGDLTDYEGLYKKAKRKQPKLLLGPVYAPLRKAFESANAIEIKENGPFNILISTGGAASLRIAKGLADKFVNDSSDDAALMVFNLLVGPFSKDKEYPDNLEETNPGKINIWSRLTHMPGFLSRFDMAVSAAGSTSYELCSMGIPAVLFCMADNQSLINETFDKKGIYKSGGNAEKNREQVIENLYADTVLAIKDFVYRKECSLRARNLVDAKGAERIALNIEKELNIL